MNYALLPQIQCSLPYRKNLSTSKSLTASSPSKVEHWKTIVLPRYGMPACRALHTSIATPEKQYEPTQWVPKGSKTNPERESKLTKRMQNRMKKFKESRFFLTFMKQMQTPDMLDRFRKVLGSEEKMKMVIYGLGSIELFVGPRAQLSLAIFMKREFDWIGEIEVFDPRINWVEYNVITSLGCTVLSINEECRRKVVEPTLFFMPHCGMYENLLEANWEIDQLKRLIVLGSSFDGYAKELSWEHVSAVMRFTDEIPVRNFRDESSQAFSGSWHFFNPVEGEELPMIVEENESI